MKGRLEHSLQIEKNIKEILSTLEVQSSYLSIASKTNRENWNMERIVMNNTTCIWENVS